MKNFVCSLLVVLVLGGCGKIKLPKLRPAPPAQASAHDAAMAAERVRQARIGEEIARRAAQEEKAAKDAVDKVRNEWLDKAQEAAERVPSAIPPETEDEEPQPPK